MDDHQQEKFGGFVPGQEEDHSEFDDLPVSLPKKMKVDLDTPLESFFIGCAVLSGFGLFFAGIASLNNSVPRVVWQGLTGLFVVGGICYKYTDNYYIVDMERKKLLYHFSFFSYSSDGVIALFSDLIAATVNAEHHSSKHSSWWEYAPFMILKNGKKLQMGDYKKETDGFDGANSLAKKLSEVSGAEFIRGKREHHIEIIRNQNGTVRVVLEESRISLWIVGIIFLAIIIGVLAVVFGH